MNIEFNHRVETKKASAFNQDVLCIPVNSHPDSLRSLRFDDFPCAITRRLPDGAQSRSNQKLLRNTGMLYNANTLFQNID